MLKSSVLKILQSFSKEEINEFNDFLNSPYHNKKSGVVKLYREVKKYYPDFKNENLENEKLWSKLYPGKKYGYGVMKNLVNDFTRIAEEFIKNQNFRKNEIQSSFNLITAFISRELKNPLENKVSFLNKKFRDENTKDLINSDVDEYYWYLSKIYAMKIWIRQFYDQHINLDDDIKKMQSNFLSGMIIYSIEIYYNIHTSSFNTKGNSDLINVVKNFLGSIPDKIFEEVLDTVKNESKIKFRILNCYYLGYKASINLNDSQHYTTFKNYFFKNCQIMPYKSKRNMDVLLVNTLIYITDPSIDKMKMRNELRNFKFKNNLILDQNGLLNGILYVSYVLVFFLDSDLSGLTEFVKRYEKCLVGEDKEASLMFADAVIFYMNSQTSISLNQLSKIKFKASLLKNYLKKFTLVIQYETNDYETFSNSINAYKHFIDYTDWGEKGYRDYRIKTDKKFCNCIDKLFRLKEGQDISDMLLLKNEVIESNIDFKQWFLTELDFINKSQEKLSA